MNDPDATLTVFAPTNEAIEEAFGDAPEDMDEELLQNLLLRPCARRRGAARGRAARVDRDRRDVRRHPQQIDKNATPPTVGGAPIVLEAPPAQNGILYVVSQVIQPVAD